MEKNKRTISRVLFRAMMLAVLVWVGLLIRLEPAWGIDPNLIAAAEKEGQVTVYACDPTESAGYFKHFMELYPKIKVTSYVAGCWQTYNRYNTERVAGKQIADIFFSLDDAMTKLQIEGQLAPYESTELVHFPKEVQRPGTDYTLIKTLAVAQTTNSDHMKGIPNPTDWWDFANPPKEWYDKISFYDPRTSSAAFSVLAALCQNFGKEGAAKIYMGLRNARAELASTTPAGVTKLLSGEKPIMFYILNNHFQGAVAKGAPLNFIIPKSGSIALYFAAAPLKNAPHPNAARLFVDYLLSDGQKVMASHNEYALRKGSTPPKLVPPLASIKFMDWDMKKALSMQDELIKWWQDVTKIN